jgi:hypothetical protein
LFWHARLPLHWLSPQQPPLGMHAPSQLLKPVRHMVLEQALPLQAKLPAHSLSPQQPLWGMHLPSQFLNPDLHWLVEQLLFRHAKLALQLPSSQQPFCGMHWPLHGFVVPAQLYPHIRVEASHLPSCPAIIGQSLSLQHADSAMHVPLQSFCPAGHVYWHFSVAVSQLATRPACAAQSSTAQHSPHLSPHFLPCVQVKPHAVPSHVGVAPGGGAHGEQEIPHAATLVLGKHRPLQLCSPGGHWPQTSATGTQRLRHSFVPSGHLPPQLVPSQVASPPATVGHFSQEVPQLSGDMFATQVPAQLCVPVAQPLPGSGPSVPVVGAGPSATPPPVPPPPPWPPPASIRSTSGPGADASHIHWLGFSHAAAIVTTSASLQAAPSRRATQIDSIVALLVVAPHERRTP